MTAASGSKPMGSAGSPPARPSTIRTRRYHALLLAATTPPAGRMALVNGLEAWVTVNGTRVALTTSRYAGGVEYPDGNSRLARFDHDPWPQWTFTLPDGSTVVHEVFVPRGRAAVAVTWRCERPTGHAGRGRDARDARCPADAVGPRLPRAAPREPGIQVRTRPGRGAADVAPVPRRAADPCLVERDLLAFAASGTGSSSTAWKRNAASMRPRISRRRVSSRSISPSAKR